MAGYHIISDSSCDLPEETVRRHDITVVPFYVSFDGTTYKKERVDIPVREFYDRMIEEKGVYPKSSLPSVQDYIDVFEPVIRSGEDILCICITSKFSGSVQSASNAKAILLEEYPDAKIEVIDAQMNTVLQGLYVLEAVKMKEAGVSLKDCVSELLSIRESGRIFFTIGSIDYLRAGGRIGKLSGLAASVLGIKPIITLKEGEIFNSGVARNRDRSLKKVIDLLKEYAAERKVTLKEYTMCIGFGFDYEEALHFRDQIVREFAGLFGAKDIPLYQIGAAIAVHTGPYPLGVGIIRRNRFR